MKNLFILFVFLFMSTSMSAQYYGVPNPFNPYDTPQSRQQAYEWGQRLADQVNQQNEARDKNNYGACISRIYNGIAFEKFGEAKKWAVNLAAFNKGQSYYYQGFCCELQGNPTAAKQHYANGIKCGNTLCKTYLERLQKYGPITQKQKQQAVLNYASAVANVQMLSAQAVENVFGNSDSSSSSSSGHTSGTCARCHGTGIDPNMVDFNPGSRTASGKIAAYRDCPYCGKRMQTAHWHQRCLDCRTR